MSEGWVCRGNGCKIMVFIRNKKKKKKIRKRKRGRGRSMGGGGGGGGAFAPFEIQLTMLFPPPHIHPNNLYSTHPSQHSL